MQDESGVLRSAGDASFNGSGTSGLLTAGRLELGGDFFSQNTSTGTVKYGGSFTAEEVFIIGNQPVER